MSSTARGRPLQSDLPAFPDRAFSATLRPAMHIVGSAGTSSKILNDYWWGTGVASPPTPAQIPICWLSNPVRLRQVPPYNTATVTQAGGATGYAADTASQAQYGVQPFDATLATATADDAPNLAQWIVRYLADPAVTAPTLIIDLLYRSDSERRTILRVDLGQRIQLTGMPAEFPEGASTLIVTGRRQEAGIARRRVIWTTSRVIGQTPGTSGPWFYPDKSVPDGTNELIF